jgi:hypothetical protein
MARHLADPTVGGVTAYVKDGSQPGNLLTRFIAFEYITAQAAARRAQNVMGVLACMAGGAQLHSRDNLIAIGGAIDTSTLAEDTYTTFKTQLSGRRVVFDGNAVVWAEEPASVTALWKQRLRWGRGNLQLSAAFRNLWFRPGRHGRLGSVAFGVLWFAVALMPVFMIMSSIGVIGLYFLRPPWAWIAFTILWSATFVAYLFETLFSFAIDPATGRRTWFEGLAFPGVISVCIMLIAVSRLPLLSGAADWIEAGHWSWRDIPVQPSRLTGSPFRCVVSTTPGRGGRAKVAARASSVLVGYSLVCAVAFVNHRRVQKNGPAMGQDDRRKRRNLRRNHGPGPGVDEDIATKPACCGRDRHSAFVTLCGSYLILID